MLRSALMFIAGFVVAAMLVVPSSAQSMPVANLAYVNLASNRVNTLIDFADVANGFLSGKNKLDSVIAAHENLTTMVTAIDAKEPPITLLALHVQLRFAAIRCGTLAGIAESVKRIENATAFDLIPFLTERSSCFDAINNARLRLIDYAAPYGVNPF